MQRTIKEQGDSAVAIICTSVSRNLVRMVAYQDMGGPNRKIANPME